MEQQQPELQLQLQQQQQQQQQQQISNRQNESTSSQQEHAALAINQLNHKNFKQSINGSTHLAIGGPKFETQREQRRPHALSSKRKKRQRQVIGNGNVGVHAQHQQGENYPALEEDASKPSNERLLCTAFVSFMTFALIQTVAAIIAGSEAMMGDSAAMIVDALTYLFNLIAERKKKQYRLELQNKSLIRKQRRVTITSQQSKDDPNNNPSHDDTLVGVQKDEDDDEKRLMLLYEHQYKKSVVQLELVPPLLSVTTLLAVTAFVLHKAVKVLILDISRDASQQSDPNVHLMLIFSVMNLVLDGVNVFGFANANHMCGYNTSEDHQTNPTRADNNMQSNKVQRRQSEQSRQAVPKIVPYRPKTFLRLWTDYFDLKEYEDEKDGVPYYRSDVRSYKKKGKIRSLQRDSSPRGTKLSNEEDRQRPPPTRMEQGQSRDKQFPNGTHYDTKVNGESSQPKFAPLEIGDCEDQDGSAITRTDTQGNDNAPSDSLDTEDDNATNLNMCSAYTHVFADTLRSFAVIAASVVAETAEAVTSEVADATAAIVVSGLILLSLIPLLSGLCHTCSELKSIQACLDELQHSRRKNNAKVMHRRLLDHVQSHEDDDEYSDDEDDDVV